MNEAPNQPEPPVAAQESSPEVASTALATEAVEAVPAVTVTSLTADLPFVAYVVPEDEPRAQRLYRLRHSTAHIMAEAVVELFPTAQVATGPAIEHGFYYDFDLPRPLTPEDLGAIEQRMKKIMKRNWRFQTLELPPAEARQVFVDAGQVYKVEVLDTIVEKFSPETVTLFRQNKFVDLCAGPHVNGTKTCRQFKLLRVSGAYWRGDSDRPMLQRIYGTAWETAEDLESYLHFLEEAKKRNHKRIGTELDLFHFHKHAPGAVFWSPRGYTIYQEFLSYWRDSHKERGYQEIYNPILYKKDLYEQSGHYHHYKSDMFILNADDTEYCLKPMNCPDTFLFYTSKRRSFRELPLRVSEGGILHRNELTGALNGLFRVRQFTQDDAHIFVTEAQVQAEIAELLDIAREIYAMFGLQYRFLLSTRPEKFMGEPALWDEAEGALAAALNANVGEGNYTLNEGDGAFYGPKIDIELTDCLGRRWQCGTIQLDFQQPINFDMKYIDTDNTAKRPIVIHRAIFGSFERFFGILLEHTAGALPTWLSPVQAVVVPISDKVNDYAWQVHGWLKQAGVRVEVDDRNQKMNRKIREAELRKVPYMLVVGEREAESATANLRTYKDGERGEVAVDMIAGEISLAISQRTFDVEIQPLRSFEDPDSVIESDAIGY